MFEREKQLSKIANVWGLVTVRDGKVSVTLSEMDGIPAISQEIASDPMYSNLTGIGLSAVSQAGDTKIKKTVTRETDRVNDITGLALVYMTLYHNARSDRMTFLEIGKTMIFPHPEVIDVLQDAADLMRVSLNL